MAGGSASKVREWMRKFMAPRTRKAAGSRGDGGSSGDWMRKCMAPRKTKAAGSGGDGGSSGSAPSSPGRELLAGAAPSARRWRKPRRGNALAALFRWASYHLLWLVESVVVVAQLVFFFVRFGFRV